jgi:hypothetical protein
MVASLSKSHSFAHKAMGHSGNGMSWHCVLTLEKLYNAGIDGGKQKEPINLLTVLGLRMEVFFITHMN